MDLGQYFEIGLFSITVATGVVSLVDIVFFAKKRKALVEAEIDLSKLKKKERKEALQAPLVADYARSLFFVFLCVFLLRAFVVDNFRIPTGSMIPTIKIGDFVLINKYDFGLKWPVWGGTIANVGKPKTGDIAVFHYPVDPRVDYIKRVVGVPGDHISYQNGVLTINGKVMPQTLLKKAIVPSDSTTQASSIYQEKLSGVSHEIAQMPWSPENKMNFKDLVVPKGEYFMMGDNRDNSSDSRYWGFVPASDLVGKAFFVWLSWDSHTDSIRWSQIGKILS